MDAFHGVGWKPYPANAFVDPEFVVVVGGHLQADGFQGLSVDAEDEGFVPGRGVRAVGSCCLLLLQFLVSSGDAHFDERI